jgi:hypothetical protein
MICPKCGYENSTDREDCLRCGVIFAKVHQEPPVPSDSRCAGTSSEKRRPPGELFLSCPDETNGLFILGRAAILLGIILWGFKLILAGVESNAAGGSLLHLINLPFHEAGHLFFRPFGRFITTLGGTLGQLLVPLVCLFVLLLRTRDPFGAAVCFWWFGENFLDIAPYINDARAGQLPLLGGNFGHSSPYGFHDWEYLLTETDLLSQDHLLARVSVGIGAAIMALGVGWAGFVLFRQYRRRP